MEPMKKRPSPGGPGPDPPSTMKANIMQFDNIMEAIAVQQVVMGIFHSLNQGLELLLIILQVQIWLQDNLETHVLL